MSNFIKSALAVVLAAAMCACGKASDSGKTPDSEPVAQDTETSSGVSSYDAGFATITIPENWSVSKVHTTDDFIALIQNGSDEQASMVDHIQMTYGTCPYTADQTIDFAHAILAQLGMQNIDISSVTSNGFTRDDGVNILQFRVEAPEAVYTQYYVVGDKEFVLLTALNFTDNPEDANTVTNIDEAVQTVVNSCVITK